MAWDPDAGHPGGGIRSAGAGDSNNMDTCTREGGVMTRVASTAGLRSVRVDYDLIAFLDEPPSGAPGGACTVLEGSSEDKLVVSCSTRGAAGPWTVAQEIPEGDLPSAWAHRTIDLSGVSAAGDNRSFALKFQWQFNSSGDAGAIDNVLIQGAVIDTATSFRRGDANADGSLDLGDPLAILFGAFMAGPIPCRKAVDVDDDGNGPGITDAIFLLRHLFLDEEPPAAPFPTCGIDAASPDALTCDAFPPCG